MKHLDVDDVLAKIREHIVVVSFVSATAFLGLSWLLFTEPELRQAESLAEQRHMLEEKVGFLKQFSQQQDYKAYEADLNKELQSAESLLIQNPDLSLLSQGMYQMADEQQLKVEFIRLPEESAIKRHSSLPVKIYPIKISIQGDYNDLISFIRKTECKYILHRLELEGKKDGNVEAELEIHVPCLV